MKQFDVYRNTGKNRATIPYVVVVQSAFFNRFKRRVVVPLVRASELEKVGGVPDALVNPVLLVAGERVVFNPLEIVSVPLEALGEQVASLDEGGDAMMAALDELFSRAWG
ncbi:MAG TPA: CcdB family protein [Rhodocyclaceae bacterium]|nr:CcdB family protein [Rhodocyclaceae bacterium]